MSWRIIDQTISLIDGIGKLCNNSWEWVHARIYPSAAENT